MRLVEVRIWSPVMLALALALPLCAQNPAPSSTPSGDAASANVAGLAGPLSAPKLPAGFFIQDATVFGSALFQSLPASVGADNGLGSGGWQTGLGFIVNAGWTKAAPRNTYSVLSSTAFTGYQRMGQGRNWNEYLNASMKRLVSPRTRSEVFAHLVITDQQQFLFGETQSGEPGQTRQLFNTGIITTPAAANLLLVQQNLLASAGGQVWYDYGPRTTLSFEGEVVRNQAIGVDGAALNSAFTATSESATGTLAYARSRRGEWDFSLSAVRTASPLDTSVFGSALAAYSYALNETWFARVRAGVSIGSSSDGLLSASNLLPYSAAPKPEPIGGASLEYRRNLYSLVLSTSRGVTEVYGGGAAIVWSSSATWNAASSHSRWSFFLASGYDLSSSSAREHIDGWRGNGGVNRTLAPQWSASCQYAFLSNSFRYPGSAQGMHSHGARLALVWTPARRSHL